MDQSCVYTSDGSTQGRFVIVGTENFPVPGMKTDLNYLGALGRLRLADRLVEPDLISERVHHGKGAITPPLVSQWTGDFDFVLLQTIVMGIHVSYLDVNFDRALGGCRAGAVHLLLRAHEHDFGSAEYDGAEIKPPIFSQHSHHVFETKFLDVEFPRLVDGVDGNHRHYLSVLFHCFIS